LDAERAHMAEDELIHCLYGGVGECVGENAAFAGMLVLVYARVGAEGVFSGREDAVEICFADVGFEAVD